MKILYGLFLSVVSLSAFDRSDLGYIDHLTESEIQWLEKEAEKYPDLYFGTDDDDDDEIDDQEDEEEESPFELTDS